MEPINFLQNTSDIISMNEALLIRFRTDETLSSKGFAATFVAIDRQDNEEIYSGEEEETEDQFWKHKNLEKDTFSLTDSA